MTIDEMEAGRELDVLVAERVMEWRLSPDKFDWCDDSYKRIASATGWVVGGNDDVLRWSPSTNIANSFEVVDHLIEYAYGFELQWLGATYGWGCKIGRVRATARTRELAICRAALRATEGEK